MTPSGCVRYRSKLKHNSISRSITATFSTKIKKDTDLKAMKAKLLELLDAKGAKYPAEHNVGHFDEAEPHLEAFYKELDPTNTFNPSIGKTSKRPRIVIT